MPNRLDDNDFRKPIKDAVAKRAGYCCSMCRRGTLRPTEGSDTAVAYTGKLAHIRGARPKSARYDESMTPEQRRDPSNAIFLCGNCHDVVDDLGSVHIFSVELLTALKAYHEAWVRGNFDRVMPSGVTVVGGLHEAEGVGDVAGFRAVNSPLAFDTSFHARASGRGRITGTEVVSYSPSGTASTALGRAISSGPAYVSGMGGGVWKCPACGMQTTIGAAGIASLGSPSRGPSCPNCGSPMEPNAH